MNHLPGCVLPAQRASQPSSLHPSAPGEDHCLLQNEPGFVSDLASLFSFLNINLPFLGTFHLFSAKLCGWGQENLQICLFFGNSLKKANLLLGKSPEMLSNFFSAVSIWRTTGTLSLPSCSLYHSHRTTASFLLLRPFLATTNATLALKSSNFQALNRSKYSCQFLLSTTSPKEMPSCSKEKKNTK